MRKIHTVLLVVLSFLFSFSALHAQKSEGDEERTRKKSIQAIVGEVKLKELRNFPYCAVEMKGSYGKHDEAFRKLFAEARKQNIAMESAVFAVYYNDPQSTKVENLTWEVGFAVSKGQSVSEPLRLKTWKFRKVATLIYEGEFEEEPLSKAYDKLDEWIAENGFKPVGPVMENYLSMPQKLESGKLVGTIEIMVPVEK